MFKVFKIDPLLAQQLHWVNQAPRSKASAASRGSAPQPEAVCVDNIRNRQGEMIVRFQSGHEHGMADSVFREITLRTAAKEFYREETPLGHWLSEQADKALKIVTDVAAAHAGSVSADTSARLSDVHRTSLNEAAIWLHIAPLLGPDGAPRQDRLAELRSNVNADKAIWNGNGNANHDAAIGFAGANEKADARGGLTRELQRALSEALASAPVEGHSLEPYVARAVERYWLGIASEGGTARGGAARRAASRVTAVIRKIPEGKRPRDGVFVPSNIASEIKVGIPFRADRDAKTAPRTAEAQGKDDHPTHFCEIRLHLSVPAALKMKSLQHDLQPAIDQTKRALNVFFHSTRMTIYPGNALYFESSEALKAWLPSPPLQSSDDSKLISLASACRQNLLYLTSGDYELADAIIVDWLLGLARLASTTPLPAEPVRKSKVQPQDRKRTSLLDRLRFWSKR